MIKKVTDLLQVFKKWLELEETDYIEVILATIVSNEITGDPVWLFVVGAPGVSKTEILRSLGKLNNKVYVTSKLTAQSLISGKQNKNYDPSLLPKLDGKTLIIKDFSSILSIQRESRETIFADLREAYDGYLGKDFGNIGHRGYSAHFSLIAGVTPAIDKYTSVQQTLGERFLKLRLQEGQTDKKIRRAIDNKNSQDQMREEISGAVKRFFKARKIKIKDINIPAEIVDKIVMLANFIAICRTTVSRDPYRRHTLDYIPEPEIGTRIGIQLAKLGTGLASIRGKKEVGEDEFRILKRIGLDSMPKKIKVIIEVLNDQEALTTPKVAKATGIEKETCRLALNDLAVLDLVDHEKVDGVGNPIGWKLTEKIQLFVDKLDLFPKPVGNP